MGVDDAFEFLVNEDGFGAVSMRALDSASPCNDFCSKSFVGRVHEPVDARFIIVKIIVVELLSCYQVGQVCLQKKLAASHESSSAFGGQKNEILRG